VSSVDPLSYDRVIVAFSGGKDSIACVLHLLDLGVPRERLELWHHDVDGREGSKLMDWAVTRDYCRAFARAFELKLYFSWKVGGFEGEMCRENSRTAPTAFETPDGVRQAGGKSGKLGTRCQFPQVTADLTTRWCSSYLKIDVCAIAIRNQARFDHSRTLVVSGERAEESPARAKYQTFEIDRADARDGKQARHVDRWRPVHAWTERQVWAAMERYRVRPHPAYRMGWGRVSCAACIFGNPAQWASLRAVAPAQFGAVAAFEARWRKTIKRKGSIVEHAAAGTPYEGAKPGPLAELATGDAYTEEIIAAPGTWELPAGAFGDSCGPV
jgi:3'-phosphoadenosine 5'-phosphosulfate sulfotransferase (PAPS reductase)/FAD synthetase